MAILYQNIAKAVALRTASIVGGAYAARNTAYGQTVISAQLDGTEVPYAAMKQDILAVEKELAELVGNSNNAQYRAALAGQSSSVASGGSIPLLSTGGLSFIGSFDGIFDAADNRPMREMPMQTVLRRIENANSFHRVPVGYFAFEGTKILHTTANVYFRGCMWDLTTQTAAFDAGAAGSSPLPQQLEVLFQVMVLRGIAQEGFFLEEAGFYGGIAAEKAAAIVQGKMQLLQMPQMPVKTANISPIIG